MTLKVRKPFIAGNWKMHNNLEESKKLVQAIVDASKNKTDVEIMIAPVFTAINTVSKITKGTNVILSAQNCHWQEQGAFTGDVSPAQIKDAGASCVILGHSERRSIFGETDEIINKKLKTAVKFGLTVVFCVGETLQQRESGKTFEILSEQLKKGLADISKEQTENLVIAYEPIWAIGTGKTATPTQAQETHKFVRQELSKLFDESASDKIRIIYGGSVKSENIDAIMSRPDIDGVLVGGASLKAESFLRIINFKNE